ncbi:MAG: substrate-binding domain-containing protein, partial [Spirochaetales bacterium]|nr:substrate-binding domain-containing protein [Candidatus Physcosoma equi]
PDVDGLIVEGTKTGFPSPNVDLYRRIKEAGIPIVFLHCSYPELTDAVVVGMDDKKGGKMAAEALIQAGCRKLGAVFKSDDRQGGLRYAGFCEAMVEANLELDSSLVRWYTTEDASAYTSGSSDKIPTELSVVDGLVCYNDQIALAAIKDFSRLGLTLPKIYSFDHSSLRENSAVHFLSLGHKKVELGELAARKIVSMMRGGKEESLYLEWEKPKS